ncbi:MAG: aldehyde dehydrogenase family protein [Verrucomicrobia bacterium]|nr:aldehyde dehydrogenase family protein [Verrucomicrobiota bacterium]
MIGSPDHTSLHQAQSIWRSTPLASRARILKKFRSVIALHSAEIAGEIALIRRSSSDETILSEIMPFLSAIRFLERSGPQILRTRTLNSKGLPWWLSGLKSRVERVPHGLIMILSPSNYPWMLAGIQMVQGLYAGNAVVIKPSPGAESLWNRTRRWLVDCGLPPEILVIENPACESLDAWLAKGINKLFMTGGLANGLAVYQKCAAFGIPTTLELSGHDAFIIGPDSNLETAIRALSFGLMLNAGRTCIAPRRVFVPDSQMEKFRKSLASQLRSIPNSCIMLSREARRDLVQAVSDAQSAGAEFLHGYLNTQTNDPDQDDFPMVLFKCPASQELWKRDFFLPMVLVSTYRSEEELIHLVNQSPYGLGASLWSHDSAWLHRLIPQIDVGMITVNDVIACTADPRIPFGGRRSSGFGSTRGPEGLLEMTCARVVQSRSHQSHRHFDPLPSFISDLLPSLLQFTESSNLKERIQTSIHFVQNALKAYTQFKNNQS